MNLNEKDFRRKRLESKKKKDVKNFIEQQIKKYETYDRNKEKFNYRQYQERNPCDDT